jgi:hypothetical protein
LRIIFDSSWLIYLYLQDRVGKLSKLVYDLEVQKIDLQKRLEIAQALHAENPDAAELQTLHNELLELKAKLEQQEQTLNEREKMLKVAAGTFCGILVMLLIIACIFLNRIIKAAGKLTSCFFRPNLITQVKPGQRF